MRLGTSELLAASCGTAIATVCAVGLLSIEKLAGGVYSVLAIACGGIIALLLARRFARVAAVLPSGAGLLAYLSRPLGRRNAMLLALPYLLLGLFVTGGEATVIGILLSRACGLPWLAGALLFLLGTWALCRLGLRLSLRAEAVATWALVATLMALALHSIFSAAQHGELQARLWTTPPPIGRFLAAVGQAIFLFMGFELVTSQADVTRPRTLSRALTGSVVVLVLFYGTLSLALSCIGGWSGAGGQVIPQVTFAEQAGGRVTIILITLLSLLASYTSLNGALLALSRLTATLAAQGSLPRVLARVDRRTLLPQGALRLLVLFCIVATLIVGLFNLLLPAIMATAVAASLAYAAVAWVRELAPFCEPQRRAFRVFFGRAFALSLLLLALCVLADASAANSRGTSVLLLAAAYAATIGMSLRPFLRESRSRACQAN